ncbi:MAG: hypothetical protein LBQ48_01860 [Oscillospiraceae bacterium]|jgi:hypothetical protein|nr:hypothetical protein [Oscillospiraceae bacterium]
MSKDIFADIAQNYETSKRAGLTRPKPLPPLNRVCDLKPGGAWDFSATDKIDTAEKLYERLEEERKRYAGFLKNYAPVPNLIEKRVDINRFTFSLNNGPAERVSLPHYGGPTGYHTAVYESAFKLPHFSGKRVFLVFKGVDYMAEVYVNGGYVGSHEGFFAPFELDITTAARKGVNTLRVIVRNLEKMLLDGDKIYAATGLGWDDPQVGWHHCPAGLGIYNRVYAEIREPAHITDLFPRVNDTASELWIECNGCNEGDAEVFFDISVHGRNFVHTEYEKRRFYPSTNICIGLNDTFTEALFSVGNARLEGVPLKLGRGFNRFVLPLTIQNKRIWDTDAPWLYQVTVEMYANGKLVSVKSRQFGIRNFAQSIQSEPKGKFILNGREIRLYGANTMGFEQRDVFKEDYRQLIDDILLTKICNMNFWRVTQRPVQEEVYDYCDRLGLMVQTDMPLFGSVRINQFCECIRQGGEMERLIRSHPCCVLNSYINEPFPNGNNNPHRHILRHALQGLFNALDSTVKLHNPDRVIKHVDGDYDPPGSLLPDNHCYPMWYNGHGIEAGLLHKGYWMDVKPGWHYGCGEFGCEGLDNQAVMEKYYPGEWLRSPFNPDHIIGAQTWKFHRFFYETPDGLADWIFESQRHQAFATRVQASAFRRNADMNSFAIHLFIDAFPSGWMKAIMDCDRQPKAAFFEYMNALSPVFCSLRTDRFTFFEGEQVQLESYLCNDTNERITELRYSVTMAGKTLYSGSAKPNPRGASQGFISFRMPEISARGEVLARMAAFSGERVLHENVERLTVFPEMRLCLPEMISWEEYIGNQAETDEWIEKGGGLIVTAPKPGTYTVAGKEITVRPCSMDPLYALSRDTGHPAVEGLQPNDLAWMYDSAEDRIAPLARMTFCGDEITPVVLGGNKNKNGQWEWQPVIGEWKFGKGRVMLNLAELENKSVNPCAARLLTQMQSYMKAEQTVYPVLLKAVNY